MLKIFSYNKTKTKININYLMNLYYFGMKPTNNESYYEFISFNEDYSIKEIKIILLSDLIFILKNIIINEIKDNSYPLFIKNLENYNK